MLIRCLVLIYLYLSLFLYTYSILLTLSAVVVMFGVFYNALFGGAAIFIAFIILIVNSQRRAVVLERLHIRRRRASGSNTPPRSLSPGGKEKKEEKPVDYTKAYPPSRRFTLTDAVKPADYSKTLTRPDSQKALPMTTSYLDAAPDTFTPAEFTTAEIKALGDFPDYPKLSGVPLPTAYKNFDIKTAIPRPYRPLRWAYHQTMCKSPVQ